MNPVLQDFILELQRLRRMFCLSNQFAAFPSIDLAAMTPQNGALGEAVTNLHKLSRDSHGDIPILNGVLLLYLAGRFENFVREIFEDLCDSLAAQFTEFSHLPQPMRASLVRFTAEVIGNPRKYGHAENAVIAFVTTLAENLCGGRLSSVNSKCLSITTENMRPDTVTELFGRIGAKGVWERIGQQASIQTFFQVDQAEKATREARKSLTELMELRNRIAHPSAGITWPSADQALGYIEYCEVVGTALAQICNLWNTTLGQRTVQAQQGGAAFRPGSTPSPEPELDSAS